MNIREFYSIISGNYDEALMRMTSEAMIRRFVKKFADDPSFSELTKALSDNRAEDAFNAAHNLKGVCCNLAFTRLAESASAITELLRNSGGNLEPARACFMAVRNDYEALISALNELDA